MKKSPVTLTTRYGIDIINDPLYNKGTAFPASERDRLGLRGLLPPHSGERASITSQTKRILTQFDKMKVPLNQHIFLKSLFDRNEILFYRVLMENIRRMLPIWYTPTVGEACVYFGMFYRRPRGMYFSLNDVGEMHSMIYNWPEDDVKLVVVTDGSRILGLGDLGINGMPISIGKTSLYVIGGGLHPSWSLPIILDVGTDNKQYLQDDLYLGIRQPRLKGGSPEYFQVVDEFVDAVRTRWPDVLIQFEDFNNESALPLLHRYRKDVTCFNDDIQGTGAVVVGAVLAMLRGEFEGMKTFKDLKIVIVGAGSAGTGIAQQLHYAMQFLDGIQSPESIFMVDEKGLLGGNSDVHQRSAHPYNNPLLPDKTSLMDVVKQVKPNVIIGVSGVPGLFTKEMVKDMAANHKNPLIFPLSNPTNRAECTAEQAFEWSDGRAIFASGSPFDNVTLSDGKIGYVNQANNMYTFPGLGMGAVLCNAKLISSPILLRCSQELSQCVTTEDIRERKKLFPEIEEIRDVSMKTAAGVMETARREDLVLNNDFPNDLFEIREYVKERMWYPDYDTTVYRPH